jgi:hypothetical protein
MQPYLDAGATGFKIKKTIMGRFGNQSGAVN